ncbi:MAG: alpha/beta hydrolase, partial [Anaerolineales bacterium]
ELRKNFPEKHWTTFNSYFVSFGQHTCLPVNPRCDICPVYSFCSRTGVKTRYPEKGKTGNQIIEDQIQALTPGAYDLVVGYSWPGGDRGLEWWQGKSRANAVARLFRPLIEEMSKSAAFVDLMSHSLGARVSLKALKESQVQAAVRNYFCTAPAVDNECLEVGEEFSQAVPSCGRLFVFHSARDGVLRVSYQAAEWDRALGLYGPEDKDYISRKARTIYVANCKKIVGNHGGYKRADALYKYIGAYQTVDPAKFKTL